MKVDRIQNIANIFKSIGHPLRIQILKTIHEYDTLSVKNIQELLNIAQPVISLHLSILKKQKIINSNKKGKQSLYYINNKSVVQIIQILYYDNRFE
tara:strand:+ start:319 stop:606 length:288 start_codon:yes stop_codon:yes gene_type:complete